MTCRSIREQRKKYDLTVEGKANTGLSLCGEEIKIRLFLLENVYEQIYLNYPLGSQLRQLLYDMQTEYSLDALGFGQFFRAFVVMVDRLGNGHTIESLDHRYLELYDSKVYEIADEFADKVEEAVPLPADRRDEDSGKHRGDRKLYPDFRGGGGSDHRDFRPYPG